MVVANSRLEFVEALNIEAAFEAIPALMGANNRNLWLDISQCARDANPNSFPEFDTWQRGSDRYHQNELV